MTIQEAAQVALDFINGTTSEDISIGTAVIRVGEATQVLKKAGVDLTDLKKLNQLAKGA